MPARLYNFGGHTGRETPLPIPNREVKPARADGTRRATSRESRSPPILLTKKGRGSGLFSCRHVAVNAVPPPRIELAQPAHALRNRRMRHEQSAEPALGERVEDEERLARRTALELDELRRLFQPQ